MCVVKTPKIQNTGTVDQKKELPVLRNPILDGLDQSIQSLAIGRSSLRIDRTTGGVGTGTPIITAPSSSGVGSGTPGGTTTSTPTSSYAGTRIRGGGGGRMREGERLL